MISPSLVIPLVNQDSECVSYVASGGSPAMIFLMVDRMSLRLVPDELWALSRRPPEFKPGGLPLPAGVLTTNTHDSETLKPLVNAIPHDPLPSGPRRSKPAKL